jgi:glycogen(starch) synthase
MRILVYSRAFLPHVGGLELSVANLCEGLVERGHEVIVATTTPAERPASSSFRIVRKPGPVQLLRLVIWCDLYHQANVSLRGVWPLLLVRRPWVVSHHSWYRRPNGRIGWQDRLKRYLLRFAAGSVAVSRAIADDLRTPCDVIENSFDDKVFRRLPGVERSRDLVFVGRLVSDKGVDVLLDALEILPSQGTTPDLTVVGEGPERMRLEAQAHRAGLDEQVRFLGTVAGEDLVRVLNQHRILVVPSRYNEPFGIVALEGIACGCVVVGSEGGGLPEAIGRCGRTFPNGDAAALAKVLAGLLADSGLLAPYLRAAEGHLAKHLGPRQVDAYQSLFERAVQDAKK